MAEWLSYFWEYEGQKAEFRVDMQYWNLLPVLSYTQMMLVSLSPKKEQEKGFHKRELKAGQHLKRQLIETLSGPCIFVGELQTDCLWNMYFYTSDTQILCQLSQLCQTHKELSIAYSHSWEEEYSSYYRFLYPDDKRLQSVENAAFIEQCRKKGEPLDRVRRLELCFAFPTREDRELFLQQTERCGLSKGDSFQGESPSHPACCYVYGYSSLELFPLNRLTSRGFYAAASLEGVLQSLACVD